ncbi:MAG: cadherin-like domain-containing protein [Acidobacteriia bacterium]|nr:cadherin-like domain-containing protein [Terriglobia bacterium]
MSAVAPAGGAIVTLSSNNTASAQVPVSVTVAANATTATFTVTTSAVAAVTQVAITASYGGTSPSTTLTILPAGSSVLFSDDFSGPSGADPLWVTVQGTWNVAGGAMTGTSPVGTDGYAYTNGTWTDYTVQGRIQFSAGAFGGGMGGRVNATTGAHYGVWIYPEGSPGGSSVVKLVKFWGWGTWGGTPMAQASLPGVGTSGHTLVLSFQGSRIRVSYDGVQVVDVTDNGFDSRAAYTSGGVALDMSSWGVSTPTVLNIDNVWVLGATSAPIAQNDTYSVAQGSVLNTSAPGVLANDTGTGLTAVVVSQPAHGTLSLQSNGSFVYTPVASYSGADSFTYQASSAGVLSNTATVSITVTPLTPVAQNDTYSVVQGGVLNMTAPGVLANDSGAGLTAVVVSQPTHGTLSLQSNGSFIYTPAAGFSGADSFTYQASSAGVLSNTATVSITVTLLTLVAQDDTYSVVQGGVLNVAAPGVLANDTGPGLTAVQVTPPAHGTLSLQSDGSFIYTPVVSFSGSDSFTYQASSAGVLSNTATVSITVTPLGASNKILVIAPHPDDDILIASGITYQAVARGDAVRVVFMTNGDFGGTAICSTDQGLRRQDAAVAAQAILGVNEDSMMFLGYPDGYLTTVFDDYPNQTDTLTTGCAQSVTYGDRGLGRTDYHTYRFGSPAAYNKFNVVQDLADLISNFRPDHIFTVSEYDAHPDHSRTHEFLKLAVQSVHSSDPSYTPTVHKSIVWISDNTFANWPLPLDPTSYFTVIPDGYYADPSRPWSDRESIDVPLVMQSTDTNVNPKYLAVYIHGGTDPFLTRFVHKDEFFWSENLVGANHPPVPNAGSDQQVGQGAAVQLNGSGSFDPDVDPLLFQWIQFGGTPVQLSNPNSARPTFTAPSGLTQDAILSFQLVVSDGALRSIPDSVNVTVKASAVVLAQNDTYSVVQGGVLNTAAPGVLANDTGSGLTAAVVSQPAHGTLTLQSDGSFIYTPVASFSGADSFTYQASSAGVLSNTATVSITVTPLGVSSVTLNPTSVLGGNSSTGTVTLNGPAPAGGAVVTLSSSNTAAAQVPASVTVVANATTATFTVTTSPVASNTSVTIGGTYNGTTQNAGLTVTVTAAALSSVSLNPASVLGGNSSTGTVTLSGPAPTGGAVVTLSSTNTAAAQVPATVTVAANATTATFTVTTSPVVSNTAPTISGIYNGVTQNAGLTVTAAVLNSVSLNPTSVLGGNSSTGTVTLSGRAPAGGAVVTLSSTNTVAAQVPATVTVAANATTATFTVTTSPVASNTALTISAIYSGVTRTAGLTVTAAVLNSVNLNPTSLVGRTPSTGTVTLSGRAPAGGAVITLSSNNTAAAQVPASVTVAANATTATFTVTTSPVASNASVTLSAIYSGVTRQATLTVRTPAISTLTLNPTSVRGGNPSTGTVTINGPAPAGGAVVTLASNRTSVATVPASVTVAAGATSATFSVTTRTVTSTNTVRISATRGTTINANLTVTR